MTRVFDQLQMQMEHTVLENGLRICYIPKDGFSKTFAMLATNFGSVDSSFTLDGVRCEIPAGVAHFLEHKMFEDVDGNALQKFSATGASPNAFTSHDMTAYYFSCTDRFFDNLDILLRFVFTPYFTDSNVEKEKGIIAQEIRMREDMPDWMAFVSLFEALYHEHPARISIAGSIDSISGITPAVLTRCHEAFYSPSNMVLVVCGNAVFDEIVRRAQALTPGRSPHVTERHYGTRRPEVAAHEIVRRMAVSRPTFRLGFKDLPLSAGESGMRRTLVGDLAAGILCGPTSPLFAQLFEARLITRRFEATYMLLPDGAAVIFGGESRDPRTVRALIEGELSRLVRDGVNPALFARIKRADYGMRVRTLDRPDDLCCAQAQSAFYGEDYLSFAGLYASITQDEVQQTLARWARAGASAQSLILPLEQAEGGVNPPV